MELTITEAPFGVRPPVTKPHPDFLKFVGEAGIRKLVDDHYEMIRNSEIRFLFPMDDEEFETAKKHAADFFIQICGGPDYFNQTRGEPRMVGRHAPFRITPEARRVWLQFYTTLLPKLDIPEVLIKSFWDYLDIFSIWMINTKSDQV